MSYLANPDNHFCEAGTGHHSYERVTWYPEQEQTLCAEHKPENWREQIDRR